MILIIKGHTHNTHASECVVAVAPSMMQMAIFLFFYGWDWTEFSGYNMYFARQEDISTHKQNMQDSNIALMSIRELQLLAVIHCQKVKSAFVSLVPFGLKKEEIRWSPIL